MHSFQVNITTHFLGLIDCIVNMNLYAGLNFTLVMKIYYNRYTLVSFQIESRLRPRGIRALRMADTISLPPVLPSDNKRLPRSRRKSIEDYQRIIVDRIKGHFDKRRKQWDLDLKRRVQCLSRSSSMAYLPRNIQNIDSWNGIPKACERIPLQSESKDESGGKVDLSGNKPCRSASVRVVSSCLVHKDMDSYNTLQMEIDISEYLPEGEVRFTATTDGLLVCAKYVQKGRETLEKVKVIPVDGLVETERLKFRPSSKGTMVLELCVRKQSQS